MYFIHLDSIRFYAVSMVMFAHIFQIWTWHPETKAVLPLGQTGVIIFFVLSGFLITRLLLKESDKASKFVSIKEFYIRRTLRIFPIYYLFLIVMYSFDIGGITGHGVSLWLYLTNFYIFNQNEWIGSYSHLWTLAIEEQFYLIWPFTVLYLKSHPKRLLTLFITVIVLAIGTRFYLLTHDFSVLQTKVFSLTSFDFFAIGALMALVSLDNHKRLKEFGYPLMLLGFVFYYGTYYLTNEIIFIAIGQFFIGVAAAGLICNAINAESKHNFLHNDLTVHLGKISYGIYLYHNVIVAYYAEIMAYLGIAVGDSIIIKILCCILLTVGISELSFRIIEKPILRFKTKFRSVKAV
ncbi:MAG: acyltransferase [Gammaproteobacteria bacterium]|jgi:peptidoglycan/LPS O-acetylase OafA/YrhL|nr:acyltransferase [Gammaproteobacteria bacterium]MBT5826604.1 acyltransferase [Gammaproteobacteria bacterium]MBT6420650.1 acyltransferase [Gammaproteobacteria bacterium]MBT6574671.1 acyltransferase [Gammaproteobacteria bacterium]